MNDGTNSHPTLGCNGKSYVVLDGFYIDESNSYSKADNGPVYVSNSSNITLKNLRVECIEATWGDNHNCIRLGEGSSTMDDITVENCILSGATVTGTSAHNGAGIMTYGCRNLSVKNNEIQDCGAGIYIKGEGTQTQGAIDIRYNLIHDTDDAGIAYENAQYVGDGDSYIRNNIIYNTGTDGVQHRFGPTNGLKVLNNTIYNWGAGSAAVNNYHYDQHTNYEFSDNICAHPTGSSSTDYMCNSGKSAGAANWSASNNNYYNNGGALEWSHNGSTYTALSNWASAISAESGSVTTNPQFTNASIGDFTLASGSDAKGADAQGNDMGAYETGAETIGVVA